MNEEPQRYDDLYNLPHHVSAVHPQMPLYNRAAQFAPFAALTGYDDVIRQTADLNTEQMEKVEFYEEYDDLRPEEDHWTKEEREAWEQFF